ncbi:MAG: NAD(P)-binding domain-containing protein, partial [Pseudolabrys sp.]
MAGTIAFIGCGAMGAPMAERLIDGGFALRIFDVNKEAMRSLVERGRELTLGEVGGGQVEPDAR